MTVRRTGTRPLALGAGFLLAVLVGAGVAVAAPSDSGRPRWDDSAPQRITGTVHAVADHQIELDGLVAYDPPQAVLGRLVVAVPDRPILHVGDTVDVVVVRDGGAWASRHVEVLDPD